jgi:Flp pilus assembly protein TadG
MRRSGSRRGRAAGQTLAEFALIVPVLLLLFMGILDFGRAIYGYNTLANAAREGARVAIVDQTVTAGVPVAAQRAADQSTGLGVDPATDVDVEYTQPDGTACPNHSLGCIATVTVRYEFTAITPIIGNIVGPIDIEAETAMDVEFTKP